MIYRMRTILRMNQKNDIRVGTTCSDNQISNTILFSISHTLAKRYDITLPSNLLIIPTDDRMFLKKLNTEAMK
jgi:hypothetical protein